MAIDINSIADETSSVPANSEEAPAEDTSGVPAEVLELPIMAALLSGAPPAIYAEIGTKTPEIATVLRNGRALNEIGIGFFRDEKAGLDLAYNTRFIQKSLIEAAAKKGKLREIASPYAEISASVNGVAPAIEGAPSASAGGMPSPVPVDSPLATARKDNLMPGSPTSGNFPGRGRVINEITKNTV